MNQSKSSNKEFTKLQSSLIYGLAGLLGNFASGIFYPLELLKIRLQVDDYNKRIIQTIKDIHNKEGVRGFYRGFYYSTCASGISYVLFFTFLEYMNNIFHNKGVDYTPKKQMLFSYIAGLTTSLITMPMWTLRIRISLLTLDKNESKHITERLGYFILVIKESLQKEGFFRLYKGLFSSIILSLHGGVQMTLYETGKRMIIKRNSANEIKNYQGSLVGVFSKVFASFLLYPFNVIRAKQQQFTVENLNENLKKHMIVSKSKYGMFLNTVKTIYTNSNGGIKGFYRGLLPSVVRQIPGSSFFFYTYEYTLKIFKIKS